MSIRGFASCNGTKAFFSKREINNELLRKAEAFYSLPIAIGTHLGDFSDEHSELYIEGLTYGLKKGINFIDTAINYRGMRSEKDIGKVLRNLIVGNDVVHRDEIIISTKGGQIFGDILLGLPPLDYLDKVLVKEGIIDRKSVNIVDNHRHTLEPRFYEYSIDLSKKNLGVDTIDIHYIHNPEISMNVLGEELFYKKFERLVSFYEEQVGKGNIRFYGIATWYALLEEEGSRWHISIETLIDIAKSIAGENNHFKFVQLPCNIINNVACKKSTQKIKGKDFTAIQAANDFGLYVTISSPLDQGKAIVESNASVKELLKHVINTEGVYAAMVGSKRKEHIEENIKVAVENMNNSK